MDATVSTAVRIESEERLTGGGPIGALLIAIPVSLALWGVVIFVLLNLVH
jgi:hypothetical protein